jgi:superfamily II DNA or RNA helicase
MLRMAVILVIDNSFSRIEGLSTGQFKRLRTLLSYKPNPAQAYYSKFKFTRPTYCIDLRGSFPSGLLHRVKAWLLAQNIAFEVQDTRRVPKQVINNIKVSNNILPYKAQFEAVKNAVLRQRGIISMPTGTGKSIVIALIASRLGVRTLVVVPNLELKKQLTESLLGVLNDTSLVTVENIDSNALTASTSYDCLIIDEAHHVAAKTYHKLNRTVWKDIYYRFFLTATPYRNKPEETLLFEGIAGEVIYQLAYKEAVSKGYIVSVEAYYVELPKSKTFAHTWAEVYSELVVNNEVRNKLIARILEGLRAADVSTLCLVKEVRHGLNIQSLIDVPFANGQDEASRNEILEFSSGSIKTLVGTTGLLGEGVDTKPCEYVIIAGLGKAKSAFLQQVGRAVRTYPGKLSAKIILVKDSSHRFLLRHFKEQSNILKQEYGVVPVKLNVE